MKKAPTKTPNKRAIDEIPYGVIQPNGLLIIEAKEKEAEATKATGKRTVGKMIPPKDDASGDKGGEKGYGSDWICDTNEGIDVYPGLDEDNQQSVECPSCRKYISTSFNQY